MTREKLLNLICDVHPCVDFNLFFNNWLDKYDKHVIEQYKADTNLKDTIREIHDNVAKEMYCKAIDEYKNALLKLIKDEQDTRYGYLNEMDIREVAYQVINEYEKITPHTLV